MRTVFVCLTWLLLVVSVADGQTIPCDFGPYVTSAALELYEGDEAKPVGDGIRTAARAEEQPPLHRFLVDVSNTSDQTRFIGVRLKLTVAIDGKLQFWDGLQFRLSPGPRVLFMDLCSLSPWRRHLLPAGVLGVQQHQGAGGVADTASGREKDD